MAKENRVEGLLKGVKMDLSGVNLVRGRVKAESDIVTLAKAVKTTLQGITPVPDMTDAERASVVTWLDGQLKGKQATEAALRSACGAALTALTSKAKTASPVVPVTSEALARAMHGAIVIRKKRGAARSAAAKGKKSK